MKERNLSALFLLAAGALFVMAGCTKDPMIALDESIDGILENYPGAQVGMAIRDASTGLVYNRQGDQVFHAASTMKVPVLIEVYRQADQGRFSLDDSITVENSFRSIVDGSAYEMDLRDDSDDSIYDRIGQQMTIRDLAYAMVTVSSNLATNILIEYVGADSTQETIEQIGTQSMEVLRGVEDLKAYRKSLNNTATASDLATILEAMSQGRAVSPEVDESMIEVMLEQTLNEMIPAGLPEGTRVAHKTGQITAIHHDAAIIYPATDEPYVLVILIEGLTDDKVSALLGSEITSAVHGILR